MKHRMIAAALLIAGSAHASPLPSEVGQCSKSFVTAVGQRLTDGKTGQPIPHSGSVISFADGLSQISYQDLPQVDVSQINDPVVNCLIKIPQGCPPGDNRGKLFATVNLRTLLIWVMPNSEHMCGGA